MYNQSFQRQIETDEELNRKEEQLIRLNSRMITQLLELISYMKKAEQVQQEAGAIAASDIGNRSIMIISMVAGAALLTVILFTFISSMGSEKIFS